MKPLSTLISEACDVEEAAKDNASKKYISQLRPGHAPQDYLSVLDEAFKAGAAEVSKRLGPVLKLALETLEFYPTPLVEKNLGKIRALLEGGAE